MRRIKVLHVLPYVASGGVEMRRLGLANHLDPERFDTHVCVSVSSRGPMCELIAAAGAPVHHVDATRYPYHPRTLNWLRRLIAQHRFDIVHGAVYEGAVQAATVGRLAGAKSVVMEETSIPTERSRQSRLLWHMASRLADVAVAVSEPVADYLCDEMWVPRAKVRTIVNGVDLRAHAAVTRADLGLPEDVFLVGTVGRVYDYWKRFSDLIRAIATIPDETVHAAIVGRGPDLEKLKQQASDAGVSGRVHFLGYRSDVSAILPLFDVFAAPSAQESFGLALVEAMLARLPVVTSGAGGLGVVAERDVTARFTGVGNVPGLVEGILEFKEDPLLAARFGEAGRERALRKYSAKRYAEDVAALYEELASKWPENRS